MYVAGGREGGREGGWGEDGQSGEQFVTKRLFKNRPNFKAEK